MKIMLVNDYSLATEPTEDEAMDVESIETWIGNPKRRLWKTTCTRAALNVWFT